MSTPTMLNLARGNRVDGFLGLKLLKGRVYRNARDYSYVELDLHQAVGTDNEVISDKILRNQSAVLCAGGVLVPQYGHQALVSWNPAIFRYASSPSVQIIGTGDKMELQCPIRTFRDLPLAELEWLCRLYLMA